MTDTATLQKRLEEARAARHRLLTGSQVEQLAFAAGQASRSVRYTKADLPKLQDYIRELELELGIAPRRRAIGVRFR